MGIDKKILDPCCGNRMFWFDKNHPDALYLDIREVEEIDVGKGSNSRKFSVKPDNVSDFRKLDIPSKTFKLVIFDPPHLTSAGPRGYMGIKYGTLNKDSWKDDLRKGFSECFRVLEEDGILIFKWNEHNIVLREVLELAEYNPLFGHPSGKAQKTHWVTFMKTKNSLKIKK